MTCFWDGIVRSMDEKDYSKLGIQKLKNHLQNIYQIIQACKNKSQSHNLSLLWQNKPVTNKEIEEIKEAIRDYNSKGIHNGHLTSICDPFLCFFSSFLGHKITFHYMTNHIIFEPSTTITKEVFYRANRGHFAFQTVKKLN